MTKDVLIVEHNTKQLNIIKESVDGSKQYILEGIFTELDVKNRNNRVYKRENFIPLYKKLRERIQSGKPLYGELDHPDKLYVSLQNASHIIEDMWYNEDENRIYGRIKLLDTSAGKEAKAIIDAGLPLFISSRAYGKVDENGNVNLVNLVTYDIVADPGFENCVLNSINESLGIKDDNIVIYELNTNYSINTLKENPVNKTNNYITIDDFNNYSKFIIEKFNNLKKEFNKISSHLTNLKEYQSINKNNVNELKEYINYLSDNLNSILEKIHLEFGQFKEFKEYDSYLEYLSSQINNSINELQEYLNYATNIYNTNYYEIEEYLNFHSKNINSILKEYDNYLEYFNKRIHSIFKEYDEYLTYNTQEVNKQFNEYDDYLEYLVNKINDINKKVNIIDNNYNEMTEYLNDMSNILNNKFETLEEAILKKQISPSTVSESKKSKKDKFDIFIERLNLLSNKIDTELIQENKQNTSIINKDVAVNEVVNVNNNLDEVLYYMPVKTREIFYKLDESLQKMILKESFLYDLSSPEKIKEFWRTRDFNGYINKALESNKLQTLPPITENKKQNTETDNYDAFVASYLKNKFN